MFLPWMDMMWYDDRACDEAWLDVWLGSVIWWMPWGQDMYGRWMISCMLGEFYDVVRCHARWMLRYAMIDVYLGMFDTMLIVRWMLVCVWVRIIILSVPLIGLRHKTQWWEANLRVGQFWVFNTFRRLYLNSEPIYLVVRSKGPSLRRCHIYGS